MINVIHSSSSASSKSASRMSKYSQTSVLMFWSKTTCYIVSLYAYTHRVDSCNIFISLLADFSRPARVVRACSYVAIVTPKGEFILLVSSNVNNPFFPIKVCEKRLKQVLERPYLTLKNLTIFHRPGIMLLFHMHFWWFHPFRQRESRCLHAVLFLLNCMHALI